MNLVSNWNSFGGVQRVYEHESSSTKTKMKFSVYVPPGRGPFPVMFYLSGLTCTWENATTKAGFQRAASEHGVVVVCPDTSPRGEGVPDDEAWDFAQGAGFYVDATEPPWSVNFHMWSYFVDELMPLVASSFPVLGDKVGITGHSMGGHGALTLALRNPVRFSFVGAFAPIAHPSVVPWGEKAFGNYLGADRTRWAQHDATELVKAGARLGCTILIDQGSADSFLEEQLRPNDLRDACEAAGQPLELRMHEGYDHSYYFVSSFIDEHIARLKAR